MPAMADPTAPTAEMPRPMPFAIMRNAHEALRASIKVMQAKLDAGDVPAFGAEWTAFRRALAVHMALEDQAMFQLLDEVGGGAITAAGLPAEHVEDVQLSDAVSAALPAADVGALRAAFGAWKESHLHHLLHEEQIMMPLTMKTAPTPEGRARVVHDRLLGPGEKLPDFDWFVGWVIRLLGEHGSAEQPPKVAVRVFAWGLQNACSAAQWQRLSAVVKDNCPPAIWEELVTVFKLDAPGGIRS